MGLSARSRTTGFPSCPHTSLLCPNGSPIKGCALSTINSLSCSSRPSGTLAGAPHPVRRGDAAALPRRADGVCMLRHRGAVIPVVRPSYCCRRGGGLKCRSTDLIIASVRASYCSYCCRSGGNLATETVAKPTLPAATMPPPLRGLAGNAVSLVYYGAPLSTMAEVIKTRNSASILLPLTLMNLINALLWWVGGYRGGRYARRMIDAFDEELDKHTFFRTSKSSPPPAAIPVGTRPPLLRTIYGVVSGAASAQHLRLSFFC